MMVVAELGDAADQRRLDDVGRVEPAAQPDLDDAGVGGRAGEGEKGGGGGRLEEAQLHRAGRFEHLGQDGGQRLILDQPPGEADALVEADEMRAGIDMGLEPRRLQRGAQEGAGRALAVGAGDVEDGRQRPLRDCRASRASAEMRSSPRMSPPGERPRQPVELRLDERDCRRWRGRPRGLSGGLLLRREIVEQQAEAGAQVLAVHDHVDHAVIEQIFGALEAFGQLLADRRFRSRAGRRSRSGRRARRAGRRRASHRRR